MTSIWQNDFIDWEFATVNEDLETDLLIIGGGLAGLTCAYELNKQNAKFILVDAKRLAHGVSASTTAQISIAHDNLYDEIKKSHGAEKAEDYLKSQIQGLARIKEIIATEKINCNYREESTIMGASEPKNIKVLNAEFDLIKKHYPAARLLTNNLEAFDFTKAIELEGQAIINPVKYLNGLIKGLKKNKQTLYENSQVTEIKKISSGYRVTINDYYHIFTKKIIMACHYPFMLQNLYFAKMYQSTSYAIAFKTKKKIKANYISLDKPYYYLRSFNKDTLIIGGSDHFTGTSINIKNCYDILLDKIKDLDPEAEILNKWFTEDCMPINHLPFVGPFSKTHQNIILVSGFQKWGFTNAHAAALKVKELLQTEIYQAPSLAIIKNFKNYCRMFAHSINGLIISKLMIKKTDLESIKIDSGKVVKCSGTTILVYRISKKEYLFFKNKCTHLGCALTWNDLDKVWISKCHGTIYDKYGSVIYGPGIKNLEKIN